MADGWSAHREERKDYMVTKKNSGVRNVNGENSQTEIRELSIKRSGNAITVPEGVALESVIQALILKQQEEEEMVDVTFDYELTVPEGALALFRTLQELYGFVSMQKTPSFFGDTLPQLIKVSMSPTEEVSIPWGRFGLPGMEGWLSSGWTIRDGIPYFQLGARVKGKYRAELDRINDAIRSRTDSIYKGQAIALNYPDPDEVENVADFFPRFINIAGHTTSDLIFSDPIAELVQVSLFTPIVHSQVCRDNGIPLKRGILLEGPYGVGKTMTASVAATLAKQNGWTFISLSSASDLAKAYVFAKHHQPSIIFVEDIDEALEGRDGRGEDVNEILNALDGVHSKSDEVITVFTTNDLGNVTQALLRPGRIDTLVPVREPDAKAVKRLIAKYAGSQLSVDELRNLDSVAEMLDGKNAAVVREVVERSKLSAVGRVAVTGGPLTITAHDLEVAARGIEAHARLLEPTTVDLSSDLEKAARVLADAVLQAKEVPTQRTGAGPRLNGHGNHVSAAE